jgi:hypothetical protein
MMKDRVRKLKTIHAGLTAQIERGGIVGGAATGGFPKKPRGTSSKAGVARRPSTAGKRPTIGASSSQHDISGFISNASATLGGVSQSAGGKDFTPQQLHVIQELRMQMQKNEREILRLKSEKEKVTSLAGNH